MSTTIAFNPQTNTPWTSTVTLDGVACLLVAMWLNGRWFLTCYDSSSNRVFTEALIGSPDTLRVSSAEYDIYRSRVTLTTTNPHNYTIGSQIQLTVTGFVPTTYNGTYLMDVTGPYTLNFPITANPGSATTIGVVSWSVNLAYGYFDTSTLVFLDSTQTFVVTP